VAIDNDDIGGVVRGANGPEAGVWVIAETRELPVRYIKIVVTDDQGRYVIPDLPKANYDVWVRGYGLVDSPKVKSEPGKQLNLTAVQAPNAAEAAKYYPAIYWYAMMKIPEAEIFGSKDAPNNVKITDYLNGMKNNGCVGCHQLGQLSTRTIPKFHLDAVKTHEEAWVRRIQSGQAGENMVTQAAGQLGGMPFKYLADWTERVAKGELPDAKPTRPQGVERNIVVTLRDWHNDKQYLHDLIASDRRYPTVNAYGPVYGQCEHACNDMPILDPIKNVATNFVLPTTPDMPLALGPGNAGSIKILGPSAYWGEENIWDSRANNHNSMFDRKGRIWLAATGHKPDNPDFCKKGSSHPSAVEFPLNATNRRVTMYDPKTGKYTAYQTCFGSHHLQFGYDANETLWMSTGGGGGNVGWINTKMLDETGDIEKSQGWTALVLDTNGNGQRDEYTEPGKPQEPGKDMRHRRDLLCGDAEPDRRLGVGHLARQPRRRRAHRSDQEPAQVAGRAVQRAAARLRPARWRHRQAGPRLGLAGERPHGRVRPPPVQRPAQRPEGDRRPLPGGLGVPPVSRPGLQGHRREQRRGELLLVGRPAQHLRARRRHPDVDRQPDGRPRRPQQGRQDGLDPRAVSARLLRQGLRRPHRRSECRLEGPRPVGGERRSHAVADRRRQGHEAAGGALPAAARSAGALEQQQGPEFSPAPAFFRS
jgi:hypothetical protein